MLTKAPFIFLIFNRRLLISCSAQRIINNTSAKALMQSEFCLVSYYRQHEEKHTSAELFVYLCDTNTDHIFYFQMSYFSCEPRVTFPERLVCVCVCVCVRLRWSLCFCSVCCSPQSRWLNVLTESRRLRGRTQEPEAWWRAASPAEYMMRNRQTHTQRQPHKCGSLPNKPVCLSIHPSVCLSIYPSLYLSVFLSVHLSVYPSDHLSIYLSICPSFCLSICLSIRLAIYPSVYLSICSSVCLSVFTLGINMRPVSRCCPHTH